MKMINKNLTDEEIIKALEDYIKENEFEYFHSNMMGEYPLIRKSLDIINRKMEEIERLKGSIVVNNIMESQRIKKAARKEFAQELIQHKRKMRGFDLSEEFWDYAVLVEDIESISGIEETTE